MLLPFSGHTDSTEPQPLCSGAADTSLPLYLTKDVRALDNTLINQYGIPGYTLMTTAGKFAFDTLLQHWPDTEALCIFCGGGNNGGDGYVIARLAHESGLQVLVYSLCTPERLKGDAKRAFEDAENAGVQVQVFNTTSALPEPAEEWVIVDAMLGTGLHSEVKGHYASAIEFCRQAKTPILAVDIPSGLCADTGQALGTCVKADVTVTFIALKLGLFTGTGRHYSGTIRLHTLSTPASASQQYSPVARTLSLNGLLEQMQTRPSHAHKGHFGHSLLIGGNTGFGGAIMMASKACLRMGPGLSTVATKEQHIPAFTGQCPEAMACAVRHLNEIKPLTEKASQIVIGPGLGQDAWAEHMLLAAIESDTPLVLDADALNLLAAHPEWLPKKRSHWVLTPHPGEAARLLGCQTAEIENDRLCSVKRLAKRYACTVILKGSGTLICHTDQTVDLCPYGNPGMASGGMGDVLSGLLGGLLAQQSIERKLAINLAVCLHAYAADRLAERDGERGMLATDLIPVARALLNGKTAF